MRVSCPNCAAEVESDAGELAACSACGHWWIAEAPDPVADEADAGGVPAAGESAASEPAAPEPAAPEPAAPEPAAPEELEAPVELDLVPAEAPLPPRERGEIAPLPLPTPTPEEHPWEFELQLGVGDKVEGPFDRMYLREHIYMGRLTGDERIRVPGASAWARLGDRPEFAEVLHLLGKDGPVMGNKRIAGWQKAGADNVTQTGAAARPTPAESAPAAVHAVQDTGVDARSGPSRAAGAVAGPAAGGNPKGPMIAAAVIGILVLGGVIAGLLLTG